MATKGDLTEKTDVWITFFTIITYFLAELIKEGFSIPKLFFALITGIVVFIFLHSIKKKGEKLNKVLLEDPEFAKRSNVYSSDQIESRYLLTTSFMQRFYDLKTAFGAKKVKCSFFDDNLMIAIHTNKNLFEICDLNKSLLDASSINQFYRELNSIYKMIDYFKLDENIGL